ncbi:MAG: hypothetical protein KAZ94_04635 [Burkholderiales bacterium]|jgi:hypothetical protein|nr:hypothetical protein [Burkholderiales bacterium]
MKKLSILMLLGCISGVYAATIEMTAIVDYSINRAAEIDSIELTKCGSYTVNTCLPTKPVKYYSIERNANKPATTDSIITQIIKSCGVDDRDNSVETHSLCKMKIIINKKGDVTKLISAEKVGDVHGEQ